MTLVRSQQSMVMERANLRLHTADCALLIPLKQREEDEALDEIPNGRLVEVDNVNALDLCPQCNPVMPMEERVVLRIPNALTPESAAGGEQQT